MRVEPKPFKHEKYKKPITQIITSSSKTSSTEMSKKGSDGKQMRNILQEFNNSSTSLFKIPKNMNPSTVSSSFGVTSG
jgi:hypothetical protein